MINAKSGNIYECQNIIKSSELDQNVNPTQLLLTPPVVQILSPEAVTPTKELFPDTIYSKKNETNFKGEFPQKDIKCDTAAAPSLIEHIATLKDQVKEYLYKLLKGEILYLVLLYN